MKKIDLLQTTILIVAILCGYSALLHFITLLDLTIYLSDVFYARSVSPVYSLLMQGILLTIAAIILVRNCKRIAILLLGHDRPEYEELAAAENSGQLEWQLDRQSILFVFFVGLGLYTVITSIPELLNSVITQFREKVDGALRLVEPDRWGSRDYLILDLLRVTIGALVIYAAPTLTNYIERTIATRLRAESKTT